MSGSIGKQLASELKCGYSKLYSRTNYPFPGSMERKLSNANSNSFVVGTALRNLD